MLGSCTLETEEEVSGQSITTLIPTEWQGVAPGSPRHQ